MKIDTHTQVCAVIGNPVAHSLSPAMHNAAFAAAGLNYVYVAFEVADVADCLTGVRALPGFRGLSVTIPHKEAAMQHVDHVDPLAARVGCINTVTNTDGRLAGSNTDGLGTLRAFSEAGVSLAGKRVLFMGAGGAVRAVAFAMLERAGVAGITILGRSPERLHRLLDNLRSAATVPVEGGTIAADTAAAVATHDVIVQGTPMGMYPHHEGATCVPAALLQPGHVVFDMVYRPMKTRLIGDAEAAGCTVIPGLEMLVNQAVLQFEQWTSAAAPRAVMRAALVAELEGG
ncbi:MAG: shikimate dehydrogenase [Candidatus Hydrogenedentota bacterium]